MSQTKLIANLYNPHLLDKDELISNFVIRQKEFRDIFNDIKQSSMEHPEQHYIIQGPRGTGKTTLLLRIYYEIKSNSNLLKWLIPVRFNEEQYHIRSLCRLWENTIELLEGYDEFNGLYEQVEEFHGREDYDEACFNILSTALREKNKKLVLFIDNIGDILNKFTETENNRLREILLTSSDIRIVGASAVTLEHTYDYEKPFYDFFKFIYMKELSSSETRELLLKLNEKYPEDSVKEILEKQPERVEALRRLTGGMPRTIVLLFEIFADDKSGDSFQDLEIILDRVTPLYKHRMEDLSPQQQEIVDVIAMTWDAISTKDIAQKTRIPSKVVSAQLKQLEKNRVIHKIETDTKNFLYQITERFFNIWYLMRCGNRQDRNKVYWLVKFLSEWCSKEELIERSIRHLTALTKKNYYPGHAFNLTEALAATKIPVEIQYALIEKTRKLLAKNNNMISTELSKSDIEISIDATNYLIKKEYKKWMQTLGQIRNKGFYFFYLGIIFNFLIKDIKEAEKYYLKATENEFQSAYLTLAFLYANQLSDDQKAKDYLKMAVDEIVSNTLQNLLLFILVIIQFNKETSELLRKYSDDSINTKLLTILILITENDLTDTINDIEELFLAKEVVDKKFEIIMSICLLLLISKKQYYITLNLFKNKRLMLKDRYKPIYFTLMYFMQDDFPNEYKRMGSELKETVEIMIEIIKFMREFIKQDIISLK